MLQIEKNRGISDSVVDCELDWMNE
jgi:hypothetical protein